MNDSIQNRLEEALSGLSDVSARRILDPVDFDSDWYRAELEICKALCYRPHYSAKEEVEYVQKDIAEVDLLWKASKQHPVPRTEDLIQTVAAARKQWLGTSLLLKKLVFSAELQEGELVSKCQDRVDINLWHLHLHRNGLELEPQLRTSIVSHLKFMAKQVKINLDQNGEEVTREYVGPPSAKEPGGSIVTTKPKRQRKTREGQAQFARELDNVYNCSRYDGPQKERWCPVTKVWVPAAQTIAAHIVPHSLGDVLAEDLFGYETRLMDVRNGLVLHRDVEKAFDNAQMVILLNNNESPLGQSLQAYVIDEELRSQSYGGGKYQWKDVHESELCFQDGVTMRPARRYLYFHMLFAVLRLSIYKPANWVNNLPELTTWPMLPTNGEYLQRGILLNIIKVIGDSDIEKRIKEYIPQESTLQKHSPFAFDACMKTQEASADIVGWMAEFCELDTD